MKTLQNGRMTKLPVQTVTHNTFGHSLRSRTPREPLYSIKDLAARLGVGVQRLKSAVYNDDTAPMPQIISGITIRTHQYKLGTFLAWWESRQTKASA